MTVSQACYVGIDVSMDWLDVCLAVPDHWSGTSRQPPNKNERFDNDLKGIIRLVKILKPYSVGKIVLEATGGLEYGAALHLKKAGYPVAVVNPMRTAAFRTMAGKVTKTDLADAKLLAEFAQKMNPDVGGVPDEQQKTLKELIARRRQLVAMLVEERNRLQMTHDLDVKKSLQAMIKLLAAQREAIEAQLIKNIETRPDLKVRYDLLKTIPAIGPVVAATLVTEMPELGTMSPKQAASLAGLAPHHNESGKSKGRSSIYGGRSCIRAALYMAALVAMRYNPVMKETYKRLVANGKPKKLALTAIMRKLIIVANQVIKNNQPWKSDYANQTA